VPPGPGIAPPLAGARPLTSSFYAIDVHVKLVLASDQAGPHGHRPALGGRSSGANDVGRRGGPSQPGTLVQALASMSRCVRSGRVAAYDAFRAGPTTGAHTKGY